MLGSTLTITGLGEPGLTGWLLAPLLLLLVRPLAVGLALVRTDLPGGERAFVGWFGVRGIGSLYYAAYAIGTGAIAPGEAATLFWAVAICVVVSIVVHGLTASPLSRRWLPAPRVQAEEP
jgi:sodium/hydrogen antiporter